MVWFLGSFPGARGTVRCVVETAGGPLSPGPDHSFQADLYAPLQLPCLLVGDPYLGGISATACAFQALEQRGQRPLAAPWRLSKSMAPQVVLFEDVWGNAEALRRALDVPVLELPKPPPKEEPLKAGFSGLCLKKNGRFDPRGPGFLEVQVDFPGLA